MKGKITIIVPIIISLCSCSSGSSGTSDNDTVPPTTSSYIQADAINSTTIRVGWSSSVDNVGISGYKIYRDGLFIVRVGYTELMAFDSELQPGTEHCYTVSAIDSSGNESIPSQPACTTTFPFTTTGIDADSGVECAITSDINNHVHIAYYDGLHSSLKYVTNKTGFWEKSTISSAITRTGDAPAIVADHLGAIHIAYYDSAQGALIYTTNTTGTWQSSTVANVQNSISEYIQNISIAIDSGNFVHLVYFTNNFNSLGINHATNASGSWDISGIDNTPTTYSYVSMALGSNDKFYISYTGSTNTLHFITNESGAWTNSIIGSDSTGITSIALNANNKPYIVYGGYQAGLKLIENTANTWIATNISPSVTGGYSTSIKVDPLNNVHITAHGFNAFQYVTNNSGAWATSLIDNTAFSGNQNSLTIDYNGVLHLAYYNSHGLTYGTNQ